jgi:hypothetical protein
MRSADDIYRIPVLVLFLIGAYDLLRGFMHTFLLKWSAANIAGFDMATVPQDQVFLLGAFGISNFLTGALFLLIGLKARHLAPHVLILIPALYLLGWLGIRSDGVHGESAFNGRYLMFVYFAICLATFACFLVVRARRAPNNPHSR